MGWTTSGILARFPTGRRYIHYVTIVQTSSRDARTFLFSECSEHTPRRDEVTKFVCWEYMQISISRENSSSNFFLWLNEYSGPRFRIRPSLKSSIYHVRPVGQASALSLGIVIITGFFKVGMLIWFGIIKLVTQSMFPLLLVGD